MDDFKKFESQRKKSILKLEKSKKFINQSNEWLLESIKNRYSYNFDWLGLPIIQYPQDIVAIQEIIWKTKPNIIIETGVARGGSLILSASILELISNNGLVFGIDIDIRKHNRERIENHPLSKRIKLINNSSINKDVTDEIDQYVKPNDDVLVILDSNHTHKHVLSELNIYQKYLKKNNYMIVLDTIIDDMPENFSSKRSWGKKNNPKTAVNKFIKYTDRFVIDNSIHNKLLITVANSGYLKCIK